MVGKLVRPLSKGQITIPVAIRRALGIDQTSLLEVCLEGDRIVISKLNLATDAGVRIYSDAESAEFLEADRISPETARWVREVLGRDYA